MGIIKTPDQRVRVFISSTINELADERKAARESITNLRLIPVFFEAGARPHPPRDLYSAYLDQSHIFVGIYWNSYGWIAPGAEISGLEDEYRLCGNKKPKLIYVKNSNQRDEKLNQLLKDIQDSDTSCYQKFNTAEELGALLENDLSVLMSEIFESALHENQHISNAEIIEKIHAQPTRKVELPAIKSELIGRGDDMNNVELLLLSKNVSLVNILGAGGTGKTTMAIHVAHKVKNEFADGVYFIPLAPVTDAHLVASTISKVLELQDAGKQPIQQTLTDYLADKKMLIVLDNFEQIVDAADLISEILTKCIDVKIIITSRATLRIRCEHIYQLAPLSFGGAEKISTDGMQHLPAVELFIVRAREVNSQIVLDEENTNAIVEICRRLDGLPLAIELAASRTKLFQPVALLNRMGKTLDIVSKGQRDLPQRQQTLRNAIEWSYNLLDAESKKVFRTLGAFKRSWTLDAADAIMNQQNSFSDIEDITEKLLDVSLIKPVLVSHSAEPRFNMLQTVHEYANELLDASEEGYAVKLQFANYFVDLFSGCEDQLWYSNAEIWLDKIENEYQNLRASFYILVENKSFEKAWKLFYLLVPYWHIRGGYSESDSWMEAAKIVETSGNNPETMNISKSIRAKTYLWAGHVKLFVLQIEPGFQFLRLAEEILRELGDNENLAIALAMDGGYGVYMKYDDAFSKIKEAEDLVHHIENPYAKFTVTLWPSEYYRQTGQIEKVEKSLDEAEALADKYEMKSVKCYFIILRGGNLTMQNKWAEAEQLYLTGLAGLPEKGLKDFRGGFMLGYCQCLWKTGRLPEAEKLIIQALDLVRESGQKESLFHSIMGTVEYFEMKGYRDDACKLFGSILGFIDLTGYPLLGPSLKSFEEVNALIYKSDINSSDLKNIEEGKKMTLEQAIIFAVKIIKNNAETLQA